MTRNDPYPEFTKWAEEVREKERRKAMPRDPANDYFLSPTWYALRGFFAETANKSGRRP